LPLATIVSLNPQSEKMIEDAYDAIDTGGLGAELHKAKLADKEWSERGAKAMEHFADKTSIFQTVYSKGINGVSRVGQVLTYNLFENAGGGVRKNRTAANQMDLYQRQINGFVAIPLKEASNAWAKRNGYTFGQRFMGKHKKAFGQEVTLELNYRSHNDAEGSVPDDIKKAADAIEAGGEHALQRVAKDVHGNLHVKGMEDVRGRGYTPLIWGTTLMTNMRAAGATQDDLVGLFMEGYKDTMHHVLPKHREVIAKAVIARTTAKASGVDESMINLLSADGRSKLFDDIKRQAIDLSDEDIQKLVDSLSGPIEDKGKAGFAKRRNAINLAAEFNGFKLIDLVETDLELNWARYSKQMAGRAALARQNITSFDEVAKIKDALKREQQAIVVAAQAEGRTVTNILKDDEIDTMFSYFEGGAVGGGIDPWARRAQQAVYLAYLSGLGITQAAEIGPQIAAVGVKNFFTKVGLRKSFSESPDLVKEFERLMGPIGQDHLLFPDNLTFDWDTGVAGGGMLDAVDAALGKLSVVQGTVSGFNKMRGMQQRWAVEGMVHKLDDIFRGKGGSRGRERLEDIGLKGKNLELIEKHFANTVKRNEKGTIIAMELDKLPQKVQEDFALAMNRHTHQVVQKAMAGEEMFWMHKTMGSLMSALLRFPILAYRKQTARNIRTLNNEAMIPLMWGLASAAMVITAKDFVNGKEDATMESVMTRAFGYSNMTGFIPTAADPIASIFGLDDYRFNRYGQSTDLLSVPALGVVNKAAKLPGAVASTIDGQLSYNETQTFQALPLIGSMYGFHRLMGALRED
jgi:hypothetical protein